jgi:hypothetical protein
MKVKDNGLIWYEINKSSFKVGDRVKLKKKYKVVNKKIDKYNMFKEMIFDGYKKIENIHPIYGGLRIDEWWYPGKSFKKKKKKEN